MVELACLENKCAGNRTEGSNPSLSAKKSTQVALFLFTELNVVALDVAVGDTAAFERAAQAHHLLEARLLDDWPKVAYLP